MIGNSQTDESPNYSYDLQVLAYLAEMKVATGQQISNYCLYNASHSLVWKVLAKLRNFKLIDANIIKINANRRRSVFSLTKDGLKELGSQGYAETENFQIKSNYPIHDIILGDLRHLFARLKDCHLFASENVLRSKVLEDELQETSIFRSYRSDAAVLLDLNGEKTWLALEYERCQKSNERYARKIKNWYQAENLDGILLITETPNLIQHLSKIDLKTLPHLPRKILYLSLLEAINAKSELKFINCISGSLTLKLQDSIKIEYPILNQNFINFRAEK